MEFQTRKLQSLLTNEPLESILWKILANPSPLLVQPTQGRISTVPVELSIVTYALLNRASTWSKTKERAKKYSNTVGIPQTLQNQQRFKVS